MSPPASEERGSDERRERVRSAKIAAWLTCLAVLLVTAAWAQEPIVLKHDLKAGDVSYYKKTSETEQTAGMGIGSKETATAYYKQTVTKVEDGKLYLKLDFKGVEADVSMMTGVNPYDELKDKSFEVVVGADGKEVRGIDFAGKIPPGVAYISVCVMADCILKEVHFPDKAVAPGDTWEYDLTQDKPHLGTGVDVKITSGKVTYEFDRMEEVAGRECAIITYELEDTSTFEMPQTEVQPGLPFKMDLSGDGVDKGKGTVTFDPAQGRLVKCSYDGQMDMTIKFGNVPEELAGQVPTSMQIGENTKLEVELIDKAEFDAALTAREEKPEEAPPPPPQ
jgi:hypothetical protein